MRDGTVSACTCHTGDDDVLCAQPWTINGGNKTCDAFFAIQSFIGTEGAACNHGWRAKPGGDPLGSQYTNVPEQRGRLTGCQNIPDSSYRQLRGKLVGTCAAPVDAGAADATDAADADAADAGDDCANAATSTNPAACFKRWAAADPNAPKQVSCTQNAYAYIPVHGALRGGAVAILKKGAATGRGDTRPTITPPGFDEHTMQRGHLIGHRFGGADDRQENIVSQCVGSNLSKFKILENEIAAAINGLPGKPGQCVAFRVTPRYEGAEVVPIGFDVEAVGDGLGGPAFHLEMGASNCARIRHPAPPPHPPPHPPGHPGHPM